MMSKRGGFCRRHRSVFKDGWDGGGNRELRRRGGGGYVACFSSGCAVCGEKSAYETPSTTMCGCEERRGAKEESGGWGWVRCHSRLGVNTMRNKRSTSEESQRKKGGGYGWSF